MVAAAVAGVMPEQAFDYTHRMLAAVLEAQDRRRRDAMALHMWAQYQGQGFARAKRLPNLQTLLRKLFPPRVMSPKAQRATILDIARAMGAKVTYRQKGT